MQPSIADQTKALREAAWQIVTESEAFVAFKALDDAYVRMGGASRVANDPSPLAGLARQALNAATKKMAENRRLPHAEAAAIALRKAGGPMMTPALMEAAREIGADIGGSDPLNNFRSSVSREGSFQSVKKDGVSYWWFKDEPLPPGWDESPPMMAEFDDILGGDSVHSCQEGGDGDAPATS